MDLKDFIKNTISSISEAILDSQIELKEKDVIINPENMKIVQNGEKILRSDGWRYVQSLGFDILVTVEKKQGSEGKGMLKIAGFVGIGGGLSDESLNKNLNRIKFSIPVAFSSTPTPDKYNTVYHLK